MRTVLTFLLLSLTISGCGSLGGRITDDDQKLVEQKLASYEANKTKKATVLRDFEKVTLESKGPGYRTYSYGCQLGTRTVYNCSYVQFRFRNGRVIGIHHSY